ncbi:MAG: hypothetical protein WD358_08945, partial [Nitriliruptoraceae bacterium]
MRVDESMRVDDGKRRAYLVLATIGLVSPIALLVDASNAPLALRVLMAGVVVVIVAVIVGLVTRRLPMGWADLLVFSVLAVGLLFPLVGWHFDVGVLEADRDVLAVLLWACLMFPIAFVAFGTRRGLVVSLGAWVVLAAFAAPVLISGPAGARSPIVVNAAEQLAAIYVGLIVLLWLLSSRL